MHIVRPPHLQHKKAKTTTGSGSTSPTESASSSSATSSRSSSSGTATAGSTSTDLPNALSSSPPLAEDVGPGSTVYVQWTETLLLLSPTGTVVIAAASSIDYNTISSSNSSTDRTVIIILSALCFTLVCVIAALIWWFRRGVLRGLRRASRSGSVRSVVGRGERDAHPGSTTRIPMTMRPSPLLVARSTPSSSQDGRPTTPFKTVSSVHSQKFLCSRIVDDSASSTDRDEHKERERPSPKPRKDRKLLTIDPTLPFTRNINVHRIGASDGQGPWTAIIDGPSQRDSLGDELDRVRPARAVSYPSDLTHASYFPRTPDSAYPLREFSAPSSPNHKTSSSNSHSERHQRRTTLPIELTPIVVVGTDDTSKVLHSPKPHDMTPTRHSISESFRTSEPPLSARPPTTLTPVESIPELPPSPPPSPATITSPTPNSQQTRRSSSSNGPNSAGRPPSGSGSDSAVARDRAGSGERPPSSVHLSLSSSGSSARFSSLFFAPQSSSPPKTDPIAETDGGSDFAV
ncbi:hypothetical protein FRB99_001213 [Tulasnella sp. 403]|nr:hypothetical protein FRB99_001213 [Tulasnella sp. 403]